MCKGARVWRCCGMMFIGHHMGFHPLDPPPMTCSVPPLEPSTPTPTTAQPQYPHSTSTPTPTSQMNKQFAQIQGKVSKLSEIYYPQALDTQVMINMPSVMLVRAPRRHLTIRIS